MKKKVAFLMASVMTLSMMPTINSYADSPISLSRGNSSVAKKTMFYEPNSSNVELAKNQSDVEYLTEGGYLDIELKDNVLSSSGQYVTFGVELQNAEFAFNAAEKGLITSTSIPVDTEYGTINGNTYTRKNYYDKSQNDYILNVDYGRYASVKLDRDMYAGEKIRIPLVVRVDDQNAKIRVDGRGNIPSCSYMTFASVGSGTTKAEVIDKQSGKNVIPIKQLVISEIVPGSMKLKDSNDGFYIEAPDDCAIRKDNIKITPVNVSWKNAPSISYNNGDTKRIDIRFSDFKASSGIAGKIIIEGLELVPNSSSDVIKSESLKIALGNIGNSEMITAETIEAGTRADYAIALNVGNVPTLLNGYYDSSSVTNAKSESAQLNIEEQVKGSLINGGDLVLKLSENAKIKAVKIEKQNNVKQAINGTYYLGKDSGIVEVRDNKVTLRSVEGSYTTNSNSKAGFKITFYLSIESGFVGDVSVSVAGDAVRSNTTVEPVVIAKAINPLNVTVKTFNIKPGQTVDLDEVVLTEQKDSSDRTSFEKDKTVMLGFNNNNNYLSIVGNPTIKTENGLTVKNVKTSSTNASGSALSFTIDNVSSSNKASKITISGLKVAASAATPQGTYALVAGGSAVAGNSNSIIGSNNVASFATDGIVVAKLSNGGNVAMKITIGDKMVNVNGQNVEMKLAPFIDAKTGTTYMQVSDIVKATGKTCTFFDNRIQKVEGMDKTLFVTFGDRTFEKDKSIVKIAGQTIPETMTNEQGQAVKMLIKDDYTCLPLRYFVEKVLNQKINWNGTDNTITVE